MPESLEIIATIIIFWLGMKMYKFLYGNKRDKEDILNVCSKRFPKIRIQQARENDEAFLLDLNDIR